MYWVLIGVVLAVASAYFLYRKQIKRFDSPYWAYGLATLRGLSTFLIVLLLLNPILRRETVTTIKPLLVFMQDHSASIPFGFKNTDSVQYRNEITNMLEALSESYTIKKVQIGSKKRDTLSWQYNETSTNLSVPLQQVIQENESNNLQAIILATDGIYNEGASPLQTDWPNHGSLFTLALGDTTVKRDAAVNRLFANKSVYLHDRIAIKADISAIAAAGESLQLRLVDARTKQTLQTQSVLVQQTRFAQSVTMVVPAETKGMQHFQLNITPLRNEQNTRNNTYDVFIEVLDGKEKILIVYNSPHPDVQALKEALLSQKNYDLTLVTASKAPAKALGFDLVVMHNVPSLANPLTSLTQDIKLQGTGLWVVLGLQSHLPAINNLQTAVKVQSNGAAVSDFQAVLNNDFSFFNLPTAEGIGQFPPLVAPFGDYRSGVNTQLLFKQQIGRVGTEAPLWVCQQEGSRRVAVTCGEGLWRWRLENYRLTKSTELVDGFIVRTAQFTATRQDKRPFRVVVPKPVFSESDFITLDAELYNENREPVNASDASITLYNEENTPLDYTFNRDGDAYSLPIGRLAEGHYRYEASTTFNGQAYRVNGSFDVQTQDIETAHVTADWGLLQQLATQFNGRMEPATRIKALQDSLLAKKHNALLRPNVRAKPLIDYRWLFALLLICLSVEWFLRKRQGQY
jgi:hypothetical protein